MDVPRDFLTMGVLGSLRSSWVKSGSWSTCRLSLTILLQQVEGGERWQGKMQGGREGEGEGGGAVGVVEED